MQLTISTDVGDIVIQNPLALPNSQAITGIDRLILQSANQLQLIEIADSEQLHLQGQRIELNGPINSDTTISIFGDITSNQANLLLEDIELLSDVKFSSSLAAANIELRQVQGLTGNENLSMQLDNAQLHNAQQLNEIEIIADNFIVSDIHSASNQSYAGDGVFSGTLYSNTGTIDIQQATINSALVLGNASQQGQIVIDQLSNHGMLSSSASDFIIELGNISGNGDIELFNTNLVSITGNSHLQQFTHNQSDTQLSGDLTISDQFDPSLTA